MLPYGNATEATKFFFHNILDPNLDVKEVAKNIFSGKNVTVRSEKHLLSDTGPVLTQIGWDDRLYGDTTVLICALVGCR